MFVFSPSPAMLQLAMLLAKATLLLVVAFGAATMLQRASAGARHLVWVGILGAILLLPALSAWSPLRLAILPSSFVALSASAPSASISTPVQGVESGSPSFRKVLTSADPAAEKRVDSVSATTSAPAAAADTIGTNFLRPWQMVALAWGIVALALGAWLAFGFYSVSRIVNRGTLLEDRDWTAPLYEIADRLGIERTPRIVRSADVKMPFAAGMLIPTIVLPAESESWDSERRSAVLMHELAHIRRRDLVGHTLGRIACALYWFHPLVWSATRRLRIESERACDDLALTCGLRATNYAEHLLDIVSSIRQPRTPSVAIPMADRKEFEGRMLAILDPDLRRRAGRGQSLSLIGGLALIVMVVGGAVPAERGRDLAERERMRATIGNDSSTAGDIALSRVVEAADTATRGSKEGNEVNGDARTATRSSMSVETQTEQRMNKAMNSVVQESKRANIRLNVAPPVAPAVPSTRTSGSASNANLTSESAQRLMSTLGAKDSDERIPALIKVLRTDSSDELRRVAAWGLQNYVERSEVAEALAGALRQDKNAEVRETAAWALASGDNRQEVVSALVNALRRDADDKVRSTAAWALGSIGVESVSGELAAAMSDRSPETRAMAMWAIGSTGHGKAPRAMLDALSDSSRHVRQIAAWALFNLEDAAALPALESALNKETEKGLRTAYIRAMGAIGGESAGALARLLDSKDAELRAAVVNALAGGNNSGAWPMPMPRPRPFP